MNDQPLGLYEWVAILRDGTELRELTSGVMQSFDVLQGLDVAEVHLLPLAPGVMYTIIKAASDEFVQKKWIRTLDMSLDDGGQTERPVIDAFRLVAPRQVWHYVVQLHDFPALLITTNEEP